jgi:hypothetical protein
MTTPGDDVMARLPELPSGMSAFAAAAWAASVLLQEAVRQGWSREKLRTTQLVLCLGLAADDLTDSAVHAEVQAALDLLRAGGAVPQ